MSHCPPDPRTPAQRNIEGLPDLPIENATANLRFGAQFSDSLLALLPMVGIWRGCGQSCSLETAEYTLPFGQQLVISHDGRTHLQWESTMWNLADDDTSLPKIIEKEAGFIRVDAKANDNFEFVLAHDTGYVEIFYGFARSQTSWEFATDVVMSTETGKKVNVAQRLYGLIGKDLAYVEERANEAGELVPVYSAQLQRWGG